MPSPPAKRPAVMGIDDTPKPRRANDSLTMIEHLAIASAALVPSSAIFIVRSVAAICSAILAHRSRSVARKKIRSL